jgi:hypothetical protein
MGCRETSLSAAEDVAARAADDGATLVQNASYVVPADGPNALSTVDHSLVTFVDGKDFQALVQSSADDSADGRIHAGGVTATGQYCNPFHLLSLVNSLVACTGAIGVYFIRFYVLGKRDTRTERTSFGRPGNRVP